jgi:hypothetical protein
MSTIDTRARTVGGEPPVLEGNCIMTITTTPPSPQSQAMLQALQSAVASSLQRKQKLGQYAVIWQNGRPVLFGADAPKGA